MSKTNNQKEFLKAIDNGYEFEGPSMILGGAMLGGNVMTDHFVRLPFKTLNRHGLISGATGTGKTKTLQILAEQLSSNGIPSMVMDVKGDLSGIAVPSAGHKKIDQRHEQIGYPFIADKSPVEFLTLSDEPGVRLRATVTEFGPVLFSKMLELNEVQEGIVSIIFQYCDDKGLPLLDLADFRKTMQYLSNEGKEELERDYGRISGSSVGAIMRRLLQLEQQGADTFFGEPSFDVHDLVRRDEGGRGIVSILRLVDIQGKPKLFSTFMLELLAEIYNTFPEAGDPEKPKLMLFIDESHLIFEHASRALLGQIETIIKLIRSKGVGVIWITQNPSDIPESVLSQLGLKIQHALRAFTAKDRRDIRLVSENYPFTDFYNVDQLLTELGIGEALVTALNEDGIPTPLVHTMLRAPQSRMDTLKPAEIQSILDQSEIIDYYSRQVDRESAYEILNEKIERAKTEEQRRAAESQWDAYGETRRKRRRRQKSTLETVMESTTTRQIGRTIARELTRGLLGALGVGKRRR